MSARKVIVGLHIGSDETAAAFCPLSYNKLPESLYLSGNRAKVIPSVIAYDGGGSLIGYAAGTKTDVFDVFYDFLTPPQGWTDVDGKPVQINGVSVRELMRDFIRVVYHNILYFNRDCTLFQDDEIFLCVGCPSFHAWTTPEARKAYQALVCEATDMDSAHVFILEEGRALIATQNFGKKSKPKTESENCAVLTFRDTIMDFAYYYMGLRLLECRWKREPYRTETAMLQSMLKQRDLTIDNLYRPSLPHVYLMLQSYKERYYKGEMDKESTILAIRVPLADNCGERIPVDSGSKRSFKAITLMPDDDIMAFMDAVMKENVFRVWENGKPKGEYNMAGAIEAYIRMIPELISRRNLPCESALVFNHPAQIPSALIQPLVERYLPGKVVFGEYDSHTEERGLCIMGGGLLSA